MYRGRTQTDYQNKHCNINQKWLQSVQEWTQTDYQNKHYNINQKCLQYVQRMDTTDYQNKHWNINQKDEESFDDQGRDGGTNYILRIKEQETQITIQEHDDDDGDDDD